VNTSDRLLRSRNDRMIAGVAGGIASYLAVDPVLVRLAFVLLAFSGATLLLYPLLWLLMREEPAAPASQPGQVFVAEGTPTQRLRIHPMTGAPEEPEQEIPIQNLGQAQPASPAADSRQRLIGTVLLGVGAFIAIQILFPAAGPLLLPALLIAGGFWLLRRP
jgi:phage shock protein C